MALVASGCSLPSDADPTPTAPLAARANEATEQWQLTFADEFDGSTVDDTRWVVREGDMQHPSTSSGASRAMVAVADGKLRIAAGVAAAGSAFPYDCGYLDTKGLFAQTYGKIEIRMRGAYAPGLWYAVWGRPWVNAVPELDIELLAANVNQAWLVNHWALPPLPADQRRRFVTVEGFDLTDLHTYAITVLPDLVEWSIDGAPYMRVTDQGAPKEPLYWVLNSWVGGWAGTPAANRLPNHFEIDSFRVYRPEPWLVEPSIRVDASKGGLDVSVADFDAGVTVDVREGDAVVATLSKPPFRFVPSGPIGSTHDYEIVASASGRNASAVAHVTMTSNSVIAMTLPRP